MNGFNLSNRKQNVSVNGFNSILAADKFGVPQEFVISPFLFLVFVNDSNQAIEFCKVDHINDDANLLYFSNLVNKLNKYERFEAYCLNANGLVAFKHKRRKIIQ